MRPRPLARLYALALLAVAGGSIGAGPATADIRSERLVASYVSAYTDQMIETYETQAAGVLTAFAEGAVADARAGIVEEALRGSSWGSIGQSIAANALYTVILLALVVFLALGGVDVLGLYERITGK